MIERRAVRGASGAAGVGGHVPCRGYALDSRSGMASAAVASATREVWLTRPRRPHPDLELISGRRIYVLRPVWKPWYKDGDARQVQISRCGFPLAPDFGGTAHAYCGFSLDSCIGDLLNWWDKPNRETSVRGYIINSRIRNADNLMIARPYSPELFRQGPPAGPHYLLQVLRGMMTREEAAKEWDAED